VRLAATPTPLPPRSRHSDALRRVLYFSGTAAKGRLCPFPASRGRISQPKFSSLKKSWPLSSIATNARQSDISMRQIASNRIRQIVRNFIVATFFVA
jgi:hypothetical protein